MWLFAVWAAVLWLLAGVVAVVGPRIGPLELLFLGGSAVLHLGYAPADCGACPSQGDEMKEQKKAGPARRLRLPFGTLGSCTKSCTNSIRQR